MAGTLRIQAPVVTGEVLRAQHAGEDEVHVSEAAVITPTAWDYLRQSRLRLRRVQPAGLRAPAPETVPAPAQSRAAGRIPEVLPPGTEGGVLSRGRCDHPDRPYGCKTEEFGSGFVEPPACSECAVRRAEQAGRTTCGCGGCNRERAGAGDLEALVRRLTDEIMMRLSRSGT